VFDSCSHRSYLVERCAAAAAVLFSPPQAPHQTREQAAAALGTWSTTGLERLFMDLYQVRQYTVGVGVRVCVGGGGGRGCWSTFRMEWLFDHL
jgi:hypothetical protein